VVAIYGNHTPGADPGQAVLGREASEPEADDVRT